MTSVCSSLCSCGSPEVLVVSACYIRICLKHVVLADRLLSKSERAVRGEGVANRIVAADPRNPCQERELINAKPNGASEVV
jgi:hypothetical protein